MGKIRLTLDNIPEETNRFKRDKPYSEVISDYWVEESEFDETAYNLMIETEEEPNLKINLGYDRWEDHDGERQPKAGSTIYKFFKSLMDLGVEVELDVENKEIQFYPEIRGKQVAFAVEHKSFTSKTEMDEEGKPKVIPFDVWTVEAVGDSQATIPTAEPSKPAPEPETETPIDEEEIKYLIQRWKCVEKC